MLHEHHYDQPLKTQVTYFESMMMVLLGNINKKEKRKKWDDTSSIPPMENEVGTMYNLNMEESAGGRSNSYVSGAKGLVGICTQGSVLGPVLFVLQTQPLWRSVHHHSPQLFWQPALHSKTSWLHDTYRLIWSLTSVAYLTWRAWWQTISRN